MKKSVKAIVFGLLVGCSCLCAECPVGCTCSECQAKEENQSTDKQDIAGSCSSECPAGCTCSECQPKEEDNCQPNIADSCSSECPEGCSCPRCKCPKKRKRSFGRPKMLLTGDHPAECTCTRCKVEQQDEESGDTPAERAYVQGPLKDTYPKIALA